MTACAATPWVHLGVLVAALAADAVAQVAVCRLRRGPEGWVVSLASGFAAGAAVALALESPLVVAAADRTDAFASAASVLLAYAGYAFFYANVVNGGRTALRVRILAELRDAPAGLTAGEVVARYRPEEMLEARIDRMLVHGQIALRDGRLHLVPGTLLVIRRLVTAAKVVVLGKRSEFEP